VTGDLDFAAVRERSIGRLRALGLDGELPPHFPLLAEEDVARVRPVDHVVARCHAIAAALAVLEGGDPHEVDEALRLHGLERWAAGPERALLLHRLGERPLDERAERQAEIDVSWRQESLWALLWALGFVERLDPAEYCGDASAYERLAPEMDPAQTVEGVELRPREELVAELDFHCCLHWHAREHRLAGRRPELPEPLTEGLVVERRRPLEWLFADEDWEEISLDT
jgi:hypothetical protein